jgi:hypothetical protein
LIVDGDRATAERRDGLLVAGGKLGRNGAALTVPSTLGEGKLLQSRLLRIWIGSRLRQFGKPRTKESINDARITS